MRNAGGSPTKTWAQMGADGVTVAAIATFDAALVPGTDIPATWAKDVTSVEGIEAGWVLGSGGAWSPPAVAPTQAQLVAYANAKQVALRDGGITVNIGTASTPDEVNVASDVNGRSLVAGAVQLVGLATQAGQSGTAFPWINDGGTLLSLSGPQMQAIGLALGNFVQATYATLGSVLAAISAGTITNFAEIDTPPAPIAWPATSY